MQRKEEVLDEPRNLTDNTLSRCKAMVVVNLTNRSCENKDPWSVSNIRGSRWGEKIRDARILRHCTPRINDVYEMSFPPDSARGVVHDPPSAATKPQTLAPQVQL